MNNVSRHCRYGGSRTHTDLPAHQILSLTRATNFATNPFDVHKFYLPHYVTIAKQIKELSWNLHICAICSSHFIHYCTFFELSVVVWNTSLPILKFLQDTDLLLQYSLTSGYVHKFQLRYLLYTLYTFMSILCQ